MSELTKYNFLPYLRPTPRSESLKEFVAHLKQRRSVREFSSSPVDRDVLLSCIEAAGSAPSGANSQPWFFALIESQEIKDRIREEAEKTERSFYEERASEKWLEDLRPFGTSDKKPFISEAPALIVVFFRKSTDIMRTYYPQESTGIATGMLLAALHHAGLATLTHTPNPMGFLNELLEIDRNQRAFMIIIVGHAKAGTTVPAIGKKTLSEISAIY